jgi:methylglutaconyl-CoA hydratase
VVGPAIERKVGTSGFSQLSIDATSWKTASWAAQYGLYADVFESTEEMDDAVSRLANQLASSSPEAMKELKKVLWNGTDDWGNKLTELAQISGRLILGDFSKEAIHSFKK